jgi:hypothetical protein
MSEDRLQWPGADEREPQSQQRRAGPEAQFPHMDIPPSLVFPADRVYQPYETRTRPESLIFFTAIVPAQGAAYHQLLNCSFDQHHGQSLTLFYPFMRVDIKGQRLAEVIHAVAFYGCAIIREWHRDFYDPPTRGQPVIESITITPTGDEPA